MPTRILIYEALISYLKDACNAEIPGRSAGEVAQLHARLDGYLVSMPSDNVISGIVESVESLKTLLELSADLGLSGDSKLRMALHRDGERIATLLVSIFTSEVLEEAVLCLEGDSAQRFLDVVQSTLDKGFLVAQEEGRMARDIIRKLVQRSEKLPSALFITGISGKEEHPASKGDFADIYRASYNDSIVALKYMRVYTQGTDLRDIRLKFCREALVWKEFRHPHILPFLGIEENSFPAQLCMVSPWMEHGTVLNYLKQHGHRDVDKLLYEIAQGLQYLHSRDIVHGDLRGANILINADWSACLADFGLSIFSGATSLMATNRGGGTYWMAPELLDPDRFGMTFARTPASDVYAFGCVCLELYTGQPPFSGVLSEPEAMVKVINGERPPRPSSSPAMSDVLWSYVSTYWAQEPTARPATQLVVQNMIWPPPPAAIKIRDFALASASDPGSSAMSEVSLASTYWTASNPTSHGPNTDDILRKLYRTIVSLEIKVKEEDDNETLLEQGDESERLKDGQKWKQRIEYHKELAETIHLLLQISLQPTPEPDPIQAIPTKYNLIARLWSSFHRILESLLRASFASAIALGHLQDLFGHVYNFYTNLLKEPVLQLFEDDWINALGHLDRYKIDVISLCDTNPENALTAVLDYWKSNERIMYVYVPEGFPHVAALFPADCLHIQQATSRQDAQIALRILEDGEDSVVVDRFTSPILECEPEARFPLSPLTTALQWSAALNGIARFNYFLERRHGSTSLNGVSLEVYRLVGNYPTRRPDYNVGNLVIDNQALFKSESGAKYGFIIRNASSYELFPYLFAFDATEYTIVCLYSPRSTRDPPLRSVQGEVVIGMGGERAFDFTLPKGMKKSSAFLKLFVATKAIDIDRIQQKFSPFSAHFLGRPTPMDHEVIQDTWDAFTVTLTMTC
ncbi:Kinase-like protein [Mycena sanguinolenta]|uniref:Kinase-like protein n=1 Tax=Mycena sanguinolenta TaxID=230812 RepID=A0A8H6XH64_9AGAR|nr:Kinase-like protein [Mycena sanguinolenta]